MSVRHLAVLVAGAGLALGVTACSAGNDTGAAPTATATSAAAATPASAGRSGSPANAAGAAGKSSCPVTEADLRQAVKTKTGNGVSSDSKFTKIVCYKDYAAATVPARSNSDEQFVVFKFASASWTVLTSGTADICPGVPADVVKHFRGAHYGACR